MPTAAELQPIADRANRELDAVHDFYRHSVAVWESFERSVNAGHGMTVTNPETGTATDAAGLLALAPHYTQRYLAAFTFRQFVSVFESFFFEFFLRVLRHNPWQFGPTQIEFSAVLKARDREEVIAGVLMKQVNEVKYENVREWFAALNKAVRLDCPTADEIESIAEIKAARDILEHNAGVVNDTYTRKAGRKSRFAVGEFLELDDDYHLESWRLLKKVVADLTAAAAARFAPGGPGAEP